MQAEYNLTLLMPPQAEPLTLEEIKKYLRIDDITDDLEDDYLRSLIVLAREYCEDYQHRAYITQTWELTLQEFPSTYDDKLNAYQIENVIEIPKGKLQKINSITYKDINGEVTTMTENVDYIVSTRGMLGKVCPPYGRIFPCIPLWPLDPIVINFTCGFGDSGLKVPERIKQAMKLLISHWYDNRAVISELRGVNPSEEINFTVSALLSLDKIPIV